MNDTKFKPGTRWKITVPTAACGSVWEVVGERLVLVSGNGTFGTSLSIYSRVESAWELDEDPFVTFVREVLAQNEN